MGWEHRLGELAAAADLPPPAEDAVFRAVSTDTRTLAPGSVFFALKGPNFDASRFLEAAFAKGAAAAVTEDAEAAAAAPGPCLVAPDALAALQAFAAWRRRRFTIPVFAITGSCGKTTAKDFTAAVLGSRMRVTKTAGNLNNEIGVPLSLLEIDEDTEFAVIEMGANHVGEIAALCRLAAPTESAVTMVAPAHLEGFGSIEDVARAKGEIAAGLASDGCFYENTDDPRCREIARRFSGTKVRYGAEGDVVLRRCERLDDGDLLLDIAPFGRLRLPLPVRAHAGNALLAAAAAWRHGIPDIEAPLRAACAGQVRFKILRIGPLEVLDDSYNASPASMRAALEALSERPGGGARIAALGEMLELGGAAPAMHAEIGAEAARLGVTRLFARGPHARDMIEAARAGGVTEAAVLDSHAAIADAVYGAARPGDALLVKGSRGMAMEKVIESLRARHDAEAARGHPPPA